MASLPTFAPVSPQAHALTSLLTGVFLVMLAVFLLVSTLVIFFSVRYRDRPGAAEARQIFGSNTLEVIWTLIPIAILAVLSLFIF
jgi:cytochrome c oxidase subunit 2